MATKKQSVGVKRGRGRVPVGVGPDGAPEKVSRYPKMTLLMRPETKARLEAAATLRRLPAWRLIDEAFAHYLSDATPDDRRAIEGMARLMEPTRKPSA